MNPTVTSIDESKPSPLGWRQNFLLLAWKYSGTLLAIVGLLYCYAGFYYNTISRLQDPYLRARMYVVAQLVQEVKPDSEGKIQLRPLTNILVEACSRSVQGQHYDPQFSLVWKKGTTTNMAKLDEVRRVIVGTQPPSHEYTENLKKLSALLTNIVESNQIVLSSRFLESRLEYLSTNSFRFNGIDFRVPGGDLAGFRQDVKNYLTYRDLFWNDFAQTPLEFKLAPWKLIKFYDGIRDILNNSLPFAFGSLLLAFAFFLELRFTDYRRTWSWGCDEKLAYRTFWNGGATVSGVKKWVPQWKESIESPATTVSLFTNRWLATVGVLMLMLGLVMEYGFNEPEKTNEWFINTPIQIGTAIGLTVLWFTLWDLSELKVNPQLANFSQKFRQRVFRPLFIGAGCLALSSVWGALYSILALAPFSTGQRIRALIQVVLTLISLFLLVRLMWKLHKQLDQLAEEGKLPIDEQIEKNLNLPHESLFFATLLPGADEKILKAAMIVLLPLSSVLQKFF